MCVSATREGRGGGRGAAAHLQGVGERAWAQQFIMLHDVAHDLCMCMRMRRRMTVTLD